MLKVRDNSDQAAIELALKPVSAVHIDATTASLFTTLVDHFGQDKAEEFFKKRRCMIINAWRPIYHFVEESPLAMCDIPTVQDNDCVAHDLLKREERAKEAFAIRYNPRQRYYYLSQQQTSEVTLLRIAESNPAYPNTVCQGVPHVAFPLPHDEQNSLPNPRKSVEVRMLVVI
ncbi:hypothetical protein N431DRAFT_461177 [Stipitochalara longipes BDJ]|nr:hypothetical protein N431DRAFT_461177 [Stipitochalara longipes BDJ]